MVERQFRAGEQAAAELASIPVAQQNVLARKRAALLGDMPISQQANYRWDLMRMGRRMHLGAVQLFRLGYTLQHQNHGTAYCGDIDGLVGSIQDEHRFLHQGCATGNRVVDSTTGGALGTGRSLASRFGGMSPPGIGRHVPVGSHRACLPLFYHSTTSGSGFLAVLAVLATVSLRSEEHTSELQSQSNIVCRLLLETKKIDHTVT